MSRASMAMRMSGCSGRRHERGLDMADRGEARIIYPTRRNLERLAQFGSFAEAVADARAHRIEAITPWIELATARSALHSRGASAIR
ncbi:hypothetical protein DdX_20473 [Ditylenchus destructor]|uniref:Uncharacterized protein n=1 Tax=Ditylenchus destructor TaxID=166010 RepID=A0AAD4MH67_9BILA|nr:hypothetical protein DdX_20473 [Ditylenchus destructor]